MQTGVGKKGLNGFQKFLAMAIIVQTILLLFVAIKISGLSAINNDANTLVPNENLPDDVPTNNPSLNLDILIDDDDFEGNKDAPVTIVEFSDYECPFCEKFYRETLEQIRLKYIETGKVKLVYRDFPLGFHPQAQKAAEAAECAGEQDQYYQMHDLLFERGVVGGSSTFKEYAQDIGLDTAKFAACLDSGQMAQEVKKDASAGQQLGVSGTPSFFVNGKQLVGAQPFSVFQQAIEAELNK